MTTYVIRQLDHKGNLVGKDEAKRTIHETREEAVSMAWYIYRNYDQQVYVIQGSDGSLETLSPDNTQQENN